MKRAPAVVALYQPWSCDYCGIRGSLRHESTDDAETIRASIAEQHAIAVEGCAEKYGERGIRFGAALPERGIA